MSVTVTVSGKAAGTVTATNGDVIAVTLSPAGTPGGVGPTGPAGPATTLSIGSVTKGDTPGASITGNAPNQTLNLTLPKGDTGATGSQGPQGPTGAAGPANSLTIGTVSSGTAAATITGTAPTQTLNLTLPAGPKGDTGATGPAGPANTLTIGTVNSGGTPSATITGTAPNQVLNLVLARGDAGATGATGATGPANSLSIGSVTDGASAGASITGSAPSQTLNLTLPYIGLSIGTVTSGSTAAATITGTGLSRVLNLTLPKGDKGDTGATGGGGGSFSWSSVPASTTATGTAGDIAYDGSRLYVCTAANTWRAASLFRWDGDAYWSNVSMLLSFEGSGSTFTDLSSSPQTITAAGNATQSTGQAKYGSKALYLDGSGDYLEVTSTSALQFGTGDFTIEFWSYLQAIDTNGAALINNYSTFGSGAIGIFAGHVVGDRSKYQLGFDGTFPAIQSSASIAYNTWTHIAVTRASGVVRLYIDGVSQGSMANGNSINGVGTKWWIGAAQDAATSYETQGYIDELRITKGLARYTGSASFTPPTAAFKDY